MATKKKPARAKKPVRKPARRPAKPAPKPAEVRKSARAVRIAEGLVTGKTVTQIAREEGISRTWASLEAQKPQVQHVITALVASRGERINGLFDSALDVIAEALDAQSFITEKLKDADGTIHAEAICIGADHFARLTAVRRLTDILVAGRATPKPPEKSDERRTITLDELRALVAQGEAEEGRRLQ